jgi:hypothetical protein
MSGDWGCLVATRSAYPGFQPYEDERYALVVLGGPVFGDRPKETSPPQSDQQYTKALLHRLVEAAGNLPDDLSGPFALAFVDKRESKVQITSDWLGSIPLYQFKSGVKTMIGSHIGAIADVIGESNDVDWTSVAEFLINQVFTFPCTWFANISQFPPATRRTVVKSQPHIDESYWDSEEDLYQDFDAAAEHFRSVLQKYIFRVAQRSPKIACFISGGEDSRVVASMLPADRDVMAVTYLDEWNREGRTAKRVADRLGFRHEWVQRARDFYIDLVDPFHSIEGPSGQYRHAHSIDLADKLELQEQDAVFGAWCADARYKAYWSKLVPYTGLNKLRDPKLAPRMTNAPKAWSEILDPEVLAEVQQRWDEHFRRVKSFRPTTAPEWFHTWPISRHNTSVLFRTSRRLYPSFEPFISREALEVSRRLPVEWQLNRKFFHRMAQPLLKKTWDIPHADGGYPYFSHKVNRPFRAWAVLDEISRRKLGLRLKPESRPWNDWPSTVRSESWQRATEQAATGKRLPILRKNVSLQAALNDESIPIFPRVNLYQIAQWLPPQS